MSNVNANAENRVSQINDIKEEVRVLIVCEP